MRATSAESPTTSTAPRRLLCSWTSTVGIGLGGGKGDRARAAETDRYAVRLSINSAQPNTYPSIDLPLPCWPLPLVSSCLPPQAQLDSYISSLHPSREPQALLANSKNHTTTRWCQRIERFAQRDSSAMGGFPIRCFCRDRGLWRGHSNLGRVVKLSSHMERVAARCHEVASHVS